MPTWPRSQSNPAANGSPRTGTSADFPVFAGATRSPRNDPGRSRGAPPRAGQAQVEAVRITRGPLVVHAGAGSGKTRVVTHRVAYAVATGAVDPRRVLVVTFTDKAAGEMVARLRALGLPGIAARTFHAAALAQLRHFWPLHHDGEPVPAVLDSKIPTRRPPRPRAARRLPVHDREGPGRRDRVGEEPAPPAGDLRDRGRRPDAADPGRAVRAPLGATTSGRRIAPAGSTSTTCSPGRSSCWRPTLTTAETVRARYGWFSVDEYQDTNPLQQRLLELWLGDRRRPVRGRRRGPDDLHLRGRDVGLPDRVRGPLPGGPRR